MLHSGSPKIGEQNRACHQAGLKSTKKSKLPQRQDQNGRTETCLPNGRVAVDG